MNVSINIENASVVSHAASRGCVMVREDGDDVFYLHAGRSIRDVANALRDLADQIDAEAEQADLAEPGALEATKADHRLALMREGSW